MAALSLVDRKIELKKFHLGMLEAVGDEIDELNAIWREDDAARKAAIEAGETTYYRSTKKNLRSTRLLITVFRPGVKPEQIDLEPNASNEAIVERLLELSSGSAEFMEGLMGSYIAVQTEAGMIRSGEIQGAGAPSPPKGRVRNRSKSKSAASSPS